MSLKKVEFEVDVSLSPTAKYRNIGGMVEEFNQYKRRFEKAIGLDILIDLSYDNDTLRGYYFIEHGSPKSVLFMGSQLNVDTGEYYLNQKRLDNPVLLFNFYTFMRNSMGEFDVDSFKSNIENFKLGKLDIMNIFSNINRGNAVGSLLKRYIVVNQSNELDRSNISFNQALPKFEEFRVLIGSMKKSLSRFNDFIQNDSYKDNLNYWESIIPIRDLLNSSALYSKNNSRLTYVMSRSYHPDSLETTLEEINRDDYEPTDNKGVRIFKGALELMKLDDSQSTDDLVSAILTSSDNMKVAAKASKFSNILKGAQLSSMVKKHDEIKSVLSQSMSFMGRDSRNDFRNSELPLGSDVDFTTYVASLKKALTKVASYF